MSIEFSTSGFKEELAKIQSLGKVFDEEITSELNDLGMEWRDDVRRTVSVVSGELRRSTKMVPAEKVEGNFMVGVSNNLDYAEHYEYGHRQQVGRYVPAIRKRLVAGYVKGKFTFRDARQRAKAQLPKRTRLAIKRAEARLND